MRVRRAFATGGPISAAATMAALQDGKGQAVVAGSDALYVWRIEDGSLLPGFPVTGGNFFASRSLVTDLYGDGTMVIILGCDDNSLYAFDFQGRPLPGFPIPTGGDVYSSAAVADLDDDGALEIVVGSDDGRVYAWRKDGAPLPGWPQRTGGFVSASPVITDLDGDGRLEIIIGSWDRRVHVWRADGSRLPGWPQETGHFVWSSAIVTDLTGSGEPIVIAASDAVYAWRADGRLLPGWPRPTASYVAGQPVICDLDGRGHKTILAGADRLYAWSAGGQEILGFPLDLGTYLWSPPVVVGAGDRSSPAIYVCGWDGRLHQVVPGQRDIAYDISHEPVFAAPAPLGLDGEETNALLVGAWDGYLYLIEPDRNGSSPSKAGKGARVCPAPDLKVVREAEAPFVTFPGPVSPRGVMHYRADFELNWHPVPLVGHKGQPTGLIQPFPAGTKVRFWAEIGGRRFPAQDTYGYSVITDWPGKIRRRIRKRMVRW